MTNIFELKDWKSEIDNSGGYWKVVINGKHVPLVYIDGVFVLDHPIGLAELKRTLASYGLDEVQQTSLLDWIKEQLQR